MTRNRIFSITSLYTLALLILASSLAGCGDKIPDAQGSDDSQTTVDGKTPKPPPMTERKLQGDGNDVESSGDEPGADTATTEKPGPDITATTQKPGATGAKGSLPEGVYLRTPTEALLPYERSQLRLVIKSRELAKEINAFPAIKLHKVVVDGKPLDLNGILTTINGVTDNHGAGVIWLQGYGYGGLYPRKPGKYQYEITLDTPQGLWKMEPFTIEVYSEDKDEAALKALPESGLDALFASMIALPTRQSPALPYETIGAYIKNFPDSKFTAMAKAHLFNAIRSSTLYSHVAEPNDYRAVLEILLDKTDNDRVKHQVDGHLDTTAEALDKAKDGGSQPLIAHHEKRYDIMGAWQEQLQLLLDDR